MKVRQSTKERSVWIDDFCAIGGEAGKRNKKILGCVENALGLPEWIKENRLEDRLKLVVTSDKQGGNSVVEKTLPEATVVISQPFWPCYLDQTRIDKAKKLKLAITAGVGSDHVNLQAACQRGQFFPIYLWLTFAWRSLLGITVGRVWWRMNAAISAVFRLAEVSGSNVVSVAEHVVMQILALVRNYIPAYRVSFEHLFSAESINYWRSSKWSMVNGTSLVSRIKRTIWRTNMSERSPLVALVFVFYNVWKRSMFICIITINSVLIQRSRKIFVWRTIPTLSHWWKRVISSRSIVHCIQKLNICSMRRCSRWWKKEVTSSIQHEERSWIVMHWFGQLNRIISKAMPEMFGILK